MTDTPTTPTANRSTGELIADMRATLAEMEQQALNLLHLLSAGRP